MASRRKKRAAEIDPLGGFSLEQLLGLDPVVEVEHKRGIVATVVGAPFRLLGALIRVPLRLVLGIVKLPVRALGALVPSRNRST